MLEAATYAERRRRLKETLGSGLLLFLGNDLSPMNYADNFYRFRQDGSFLYYWGLDVPGFAALIDVEADEEAIYGHDPTVEEIVWTGPQPSLGELCSRAGVSASRSPGALMEDVRGEVARGRTVHLLPQYRAENRIRVSELLDVPVSAVDEHVSRPFVEAVVAQRSVKSAGEVEEIELALDVSYEMHTLAMRLTRPGAVEREIACAVEGVLLSRGSVASFPVIFSVRGEVLHNHSYENVMREGDLAVHDSGATSPAGYASDITRTLPVSGSFTPRQAEIYGIVLRAQERAIEAMRPGVPFRDVHLLACRELAAGLTDAGLMRGDVDEAVAAGAHALFMPHGLGHMMGLDVHDMEALGEDAVGYGEGFERSEQFGLCYLRLARPLRPGFVVTVEPGVYFIGPLIDEWKAEGRFRDFIDYDRVEEYRDFGGIRVEEDVLVTEDGRRVLGPPIPRTAEEVEGEMSAG
jgi:Xaa-Pro aminopeptidase